MASPIDSNVRLYHLGTDIKTKTTPITIKAIDHFIKKNKDTLTNQSLKDLSMIIQTRIDELKPIRGNPQVNNIYSNLLVLNSSVKQIMLKKETEMPEQVYSRKRFRQEVNQDIEDIKKKILRQ
jgi:hypothetical protein